MQSPAFFATALLCASFLAALPATAENLVDIYGLAKQRDPRYLAMRSEYEATGFAVKEARAALLPQVAFNYNRTNTDQNITRSENQVFAAGATSYPTNDRTLSISQPIFRLSSWRNWQQSQASEKQAAAAYAAAEQDLIVRTATAYMAVLAAEDALNLAKGEGESIKRQLELADAKFKSGQAVRVNLYDAVARNALKQSDVIAAENDLADKKQALREVIGTPVNALVPIADKAPLIRPQPLDAEQWVQSALDKNLLLEARLQAVEVARQEIDKSRAGYYPTLDLVISRNQRVTGGSLFGGGSSVNTNDVMLRANIPLYDGGATDAGIDKAGARHQSALQDLERDRRQVERQARAAYAGVVSGITRAAALEQSVQALDSARNLKEQGYKAGISTMLGVLDAERDLYAVRRDAAQSRYDYQLNMLRLKQAAGTLNEDDLAAVGRAAP
ncbi:MAG: TolC family outer membrane protein [Pseudomonadota bacterium]